VAGIAVIGTAGVVSPAAANEGRGGVAGDAVETGRDMRGHRIDLAYRDETIVAGLAIIDDTSMVEGRGYKATRAMADPTILVGIDVIGLLGRGKTGVVTGRAIIDDTGVIEGRRYKSGGLVAVDAIAIGRYVVVVLALGEEAVVTGDTVVDDTLVVEVRIGKSRGCMTGRAVLRDWNMRRIDLGGCAGRVYPVVARRAIIDNPTMVKYGRLECAASGVANPTILGRGDVVGLRALADRCDAVMTGIAAGGQQGRAGVIDEGIREVGRVVTHRAIRASDRVRRAGRLAPGP